MVPTSVLQGFCGIGEIILILQMRNSSLERWCSLLKELCLSDSKALLLPTAVLYCMTTFWRPLDKKVLLFGLK